MKCWTAVLHQMVWVTAIKWWKFLWPHRRYVWLFKRFVWIEHLIFAARTNRWTGTLRWRWFRSKSKNNKRKSVINKSQTLTTKLNSSVWMPSAVTHKHKLKQNISKIGYLRCKLKIDDELIIIMVKPLPISIKTIKTKWRSEPIEFRGEIIIWYEQLLPFLQEIISFFDYRTDESSMMIDMIPSLFVPPAISGDDEKLARNW